MVYGNQQKVKERRALYPRVLGPSIQPDNQSEPPGAPSESPSFEQVLIKLPAARVHLQPPFNVAGPAPLHHLLSQAMQRFKCILGRVPLLIHGSGPTSCFGLLGLHVNAATVAVSRYLNRSPAQKIAAHKL